MWASTAQASPIWSRRNRLDRGSARSARQPGLLPISAPQARAHRANQVGAAPCRLGADDGPLISFPFPVLQSRSESGTGGLETGTRSEGHHPRRGGTARRLPGWHDARELVAQILEVARADAQIEHFLDPGGFAGSRLGRLGRWTPTSGASAGPPNCTP